MGCAPIRTLQMYRVAALLSLAAQREKRPGVASILALRWGDIMQTCDNIPDLV